MKAIELQSVRRLVMIDVEAPVISRPDQVLVQVKQVGICGSEVHAFEGTHPYRKAPAILGHETAGIVVDCGAAITRFRSGDRVIIDPQWTCRVCSYCQSGDINHCPSKRVLGTPQWPGAFGELVIAPEQSVFALPDQLSFLQGAMIEPLTVAVHVARRARVAAGESVAILGTGSIGGMVSGVCRALGADLILTADVHQHCLNAARERMGATHDFLLPDDDFVDKALALTGGRGVDAVFITGDDPGLVQLALNLLKRGGTAVLVALLTKSPLSLWAYDLIGSEKSLIGSNMATHADVTQAVELAASGRVDVEGIVTHRLPLAQGQHGMELAHNKRDDAIKVVLTVSD